MYPVCCKPKTWRVKSNESPAAKTIENQAQPAPHTPARCGAARLRSGAGSRLADGGDVVLLFDEDHPGGVSDDMRPGLLAVHVDGFPRTGASLPCRHSPHSASCSRKSTAMSVGPSVSKRF